MHTVAFLEFMNYDMCNNVIMIAKHNFVQKQFNSSLYLFHAEIFVPLKCVLDLVQSMFSVLIYGVKRFQMRALNKEDIFNSRKLRLEIPYGHCKFFEVIMCLLASFRFCARLAYFYTLHAFFRSPILLIYCKDLKSKRE